MILDFEKYYSVSPSSAQKIACLCDNCGEVRLAIKQNINCMIGGTYTLCQLCRNKTTVIPGNVGIRRSAEHKRKTGLASKGRKQPAWAIAKAAERFTGSNNPKWNPDRTQVKRNERARKEAYSLLHSTLKRIGASKSVQTQTLLGYSAQELYDHIESLFSPGMSWANRKVWHIDHIKPVAVFVKEGITDLAIINALSNLRPLLVSENCSRKDHLRAA